MVASIYQVYMYACRVILNHTFGYQLTLNINEGIRSHRVENMLCCNGLLGIRQKVGLLWATCSFQCLVLEWWHGNSSSFALHKLHFHCDSRARPALQPIASLTINLISENAVHLFGCEGIEFLMKRLLSRRTLWIMPLYICGFLLFFFQMKWAYLQDQVIIIWAEVQF